MNEQNNQFEAYGDFYEEEVQEQTKEYKTVATINVMYESSYAKDFYDAISFIMQKVEEINAKYNCRQITNIQIRTLSNSYVEYLNEDN